MTQPLSFQLSYGDCDVVGIAYFAMYYPWMERAWTSWLYAQGLRSGELVDELGILTVGVHSDCTYRSMVRVFDVLTIRPTLDRVGTTSWTIGFDFLREDEVVTHGTITFVSRSPDGASKAAVPERLLEVLHRLPAREDVPA